jgi:soluble cytochrome b562
MSISAMKQALEALENVRIEYDFHGNPADEENKMIEPAITALREAIAEAEKQKPVAWEGIRETVELRGSHSEEYEEGFWAGLRAYEAKLKEKNS